MKKAEMQKIAKAFIEGKNPKNAAGCYITPDGSVFYRDYSGLQFARAAAGSPDKVYEFDANADLVTPLDAESERVELIAKIGDDSTNKYSSQQLANLSNEGLRKLASDIKTSTNDQPTVDEDDEDDDAINLDRMNRNDLISLLSELDPSYEVKKETKAELKDLIVEANTLTGYTSESLIGLLRVLSPDVITENTTNEDVIKVLSNDEIKALVLNARDEVEIDQDITDKLFTLTSSEPQGDTQGVDEDDDNGEQL